MESASKAAGVAPDTQKQQARQAPSPQQPDPSSPAEPVERVRSVNARIWSSVVVLLVLLSLVVPLTAAGLWDPVEVTSADQARRAAIHLLGADGLSVDGAPEAIPTVEEVGRGELPVLSMALGLSLFGAHAWAARLPLVLWTLLGALALYWVVARLENRRAALLSVAVLVTSPLVFAQARTALGEAVTMSALTVAFAGLLLAWAGPELSARARVGACLVGVVGLMAGFLSRGLLIGVAIPASAVGLAWLFIGSKKDRLPTAMGGSILAVGMVALVWGTWALFHGEPQVYSKIIGSTLTDPKQMPTHDVVVHYLGHGLFPWSALLPLALGVVTRPTTGSRAALRLALVLTIAIAVFAFSITISRTGPIPFGAPFALAALCALLLLSLDRAERGVLSAMMCAALLVLLYKDFDNFPEKGLSPLMPGSSSAFPEGMATTGKLYLQVATAVGLIACVIVVLSRLRWSALASGLLTSKRRIVAKFGRGLSFTVAVVERAWRFAFGWTRSPRAFVLGGALLAAGAVLSLGYYPALAAQLSPAGVYQEYQDRAQPGEPLAVMGGGAVRGSVFYAGAAVKNFTAVDAAINWLGETQGQRRWLILKAPDLARANSQFRARSGALNLPVLNAESSEILLASNRLVDQELNVNPLADIVRSDDPALRHTPLAKWGSELELAGWEIRHENGRATDTLQPGKTYEFVTAYRVKKRVKSSWESFIHIDGDGKRINGDHKLTEDKYPLRYWLPGDVIVDRHEFKVEPNFGNGEYSVYFGLFSGKKRYSITAGEHKDNRLQAGVIRIAR